MQQLGVKPVNVYGFEVVETQPGVLFVGLGEPQGKINTCQEVALPASIQLNCDVVFTTVLAVTPKGLGQEAAGAQVIFDDQPVWLTVLFEINTKYKHPFAADDVADCGKVVPE